MSKIYFIIRIRNHVLWCKYKIKKTLKNRINLYHRKLRIPDVFFLLIWNKTAKITRFISKKQNTLRVTLHLTNYVASSFPVTCQFFNSCLIDQLLRIQIMIDFIIEKDIFLRIQDIITNMVHFVFQLSFL